MMASSVRMLWRQCLIAGTMPLVSRPAKDSVKRTPEIHIYHIFTDIRR